MQAGFFFRTRNFNQFLDVSANTASVGVHCYYTHSYPVLFGP